MDDTAAAERAVTAGDPDPRVSRLEAAGGTERGLAGDAASSVLWTVAQKWVIRVTGLVTIAILTRLLSPEDFGLVAIALSMLLLVQLLSDLGFSTYIVQAENPTARTLSTAFWFSAAAGLVLTGLLALCAPLVGLILRTPDAVPVVQGLAPAALLVALGSVPLALLRRDLRFRAIAIQAAVAGAVGQAIAIVFAFGGLGVWALIAQTLSYQLLATTLAWWAARWRPTGGFSGRALGEMASFGVKVVGIEFVALGRAWAENAIIVIFLGTTGLGYLSIAQRLIQIFQDLTTTALVPVSVVVFSRIRNTTDRLRSGYLRAQSASYAVVVPVMVVLAAGAPALIPLFFGDQWGPSVVPAQILAIAGIFTLGALDQGLFLGLGKPGSWFVYAVVIDAATVGATMAAVHFGLSAIAVGFLLVAISATSARWVLVGRQLQAHWWTVAAPLARCAVPAAAAAAGGFGVAHAASDLDPLVELALVGAVILTVYLPLIRWSMPDTWLEVRRLVVSLVRRVGIGISVLDGSGGRHRAVPAAGDRPSRPSGHSSRRRAATLRGNP